MTDEGDDAGDSVDDPDAFEAVVDGALERALLAETDGRRYFALAGAVERVREETFDPQTDPLTAALVCTAAVAALDSSAPVPTRSPPEAQGELVAVGAATAAQRFDVADERVAANAGLPLSDLRARLKEQSRGSR
ncbi:hypothetical protein [Halogeometricum limi]|uniref:Uncharacterized protein n=1 Tax=Halogeometricum limi TaxID=555875 RepID=A0A1I6HTE6_9EURY|nr:hypothetical protein [Halogeometricum limi]SFR57668.1 hypothetical protein SAMN04488124_2423 [Halogeometricum limi]